MTVIARVRRHRRRKARCLWCGRTYALTSRGQVRRHARYLGTASRRGCLGSGQVPAMPATGAQP